jgi:uncharacterized protein (TIGR02246 family)
MINQKNQVMKNIVVFFCAFISLTGCNAHHKVDTLAEAESIRTLEDQWTAAFVATDADQVMSLYAPEAVSMSSDKPTLNGIRAIREGMESLVSDTTLIFNTYKCNVDAVEVSASGDLAYVRGHDEITMKTKDGLVKDEGRWVDIWKKIEGQWKIIVGISNDDKPLTKQ